MMNTAFTIDPQEIRQRAYARWQERGCAEGAPETDWFEAEQELACEALVAARTSAKPIVAAAAPGEEAGKVPEKGAKTAPPPRPTISRKPTTRGTKISTPLTTPDDGTRAASAPSARVTRRRAVASTR